MATEYLTVNHLFTKELIRIFSQIEIEESLSWNGTPCWIWTGSKTSQNYGKVYIYYSRPLVHRLMFAWLVHPIPRGKDDGCLDHLCRRTLCCNPIHLDFTTSAINTLRGEGPPAKHARKTVCKHGHDAFYQMQEGKRIRRRCRTCVNLRSKQHYEKQKKYYQEYAKTYRAAHREVINERQKVAYWTKRQSRTP